MFKKTHRGILTLMLLTTGLLLGNASYAALAFPGPLPGADIPTNPDIVGTVLQLNYTVGGAPGGVNNLLTIAETGGSGGTFKNSSGTSYTITNLDYALSAVLDSAEDNVNDNKLLSGTLTITGGISGPGITIPNGSTLLTATLTNFGTSWPATGGTNAGVFQFLGNITSSNSLLGFGNKLVVNYNSLNLGALQDPVESFDPTVNFSGTGNANNYAAVPEPGTLILLATGGLALCGVRRRYPAAN